MGTQKIPAPAQLRAPARSSPGEPVTQLHRPTSAQHTVAQNPTSSLKKSSALDRHFCDSCVQCRMGSNRLVATCGTPEASHDLAECLSSCISSTETAQRDPCPGGLLPQTGASLRLDTSVPGEERAKRSPCSQKQKYTLLSGQQVLGNRKVSTAGRGWSAWKGVCDFKQDPGARTEAEQVGALGGEGGQGQVPEAAGCAPLLGLLSQDHRHQGSRKTFLI